MDNSTGISSVEGEKNLSNIDLLYDFLFDMNNITLYRREEIPNHSKDDTVYNTSYKLFEDYESSLKIENNFDKRYEPFCDSNPLKVDKERRSNNYNFIKANIINVISFKFFCQLKNGYFIYFKNEKLQFYNCFYKIISEIELNGQISCIHEIVKNSEIKILVFTKNSYLYEIPVENINEYKERKRKTDINDINFILKIEPLKFVISCNEGTYLYEGIFQL